LGFPDIEEIKRYLHARRAAYITNLRVRTTDGLILATVYNTSIAKKAGQGKTSHRQLSYLKKIIQDRFRADIKFVILQGKENFELEAGLNALLREKVSDSFESCFLTISEPQQADAWIEVVGIPSMSLKEIMKKIEHLVRNFLALYEINLSHVHWGGTDNEFISLPAILRAIKIVAPIDEAGLSALLVEKGYSIPPVAWLKKKLDILRKRGMVIRRGDGKYTLSAGGVESVPCGKMRTSSDVERALALGRKKW
jgi:hypothetical protein